TLHLDLYFLITCWCSSRMDCKSLGDRPFSLSSLEEYSSSVILLLPLAMKHIGGGGRGGSSSSCMAIPTIVFLDSLSFESSLEVLPSVTHSPRKALIFSFLLKDLFLLESFFSWFFLECLC